MQGTCTDARPYVRPFAAIDAVVRLSRTGIHNDIRPVSAPRRNLVWKHQASATAEAAGRGLSLAVVGRRSYTSSLNASDGPARGQEGAAPMARSHRSAVTGRYISKTAAARSPKTSVSHGGHFSRSSGSRSVVTGRFVQESTAKRHPDKTIREG